MSTTREAVPDGRAELPAAPYAKLSPGPGRPATEVAAHQRARIHSAMVELAAERGYAAVTVRELAGAAGVSTRSFYTHFSGKQDCFLKTYELVVRRAAKRIVAAQAGECDWRQRLRLALGAFARELERDPLAARLALIEAYAVGPKALEQVHGTELIFEAMVKESFARSPDAIYIPPLLINGIVSGAASAARSRLLAGESGGSARFGRELTEWALRYHSESVASLEMFDHQGSGRTVNGSLETAIDVDASVCSPTDDRGMILSAVAKLVAVEGYDRLTVPRIRAAAGIPRRTFATHFNGVSDCFLSALDLHASEVLKRAAQAQAAGSTRPGGVYRAIATLCANVADDPVLAKVCFIETATPGPEGMRSRQPLTVGIADLVRKGAASGPSRPDSFTLEASVGAVWDVLHKHVVRGRAKQLPRRAASLSFLALAPSIGAAAAEDAIRWELVG